MTKKEVLEARLEHPVEEALLDFLAWMGLDHLKAQEVMRASFERDAVARRS